MIMCDFLVCFKIPVKLTGSAFHGDGLIISVVTNAIIEALICTTSSLKMNNCHKI